MTFEFDLRRAVLVDSGNNRPTKEVRAWSAAAWLAQQAACDLWQVRKTSKGRIARVNA